MILVTLMFDAGVIIVRRNKMLVSPRGQRVQEMLYNLEISCYNTVWISCIE